MTTNNTIVLLGGGGLGPWAWGRVTPTLIDRGFRTITPQLRGPSGSAVEPSLSDWVDDVTNAIADEEGREITLVAHSFAGYVAAGVLAEAADQVGRAVFLDALLPRPGTSWFDVVGPETEQFMTALATDGAIPWFSRDQLDQFYPGHGISEADFAWMQPQLTPQPIAAFTERATNRPLQPARVEHVYVQCRRTTPPVADITESTPGWTYRTLDSGHWPMITDPDTTALVIAELAAG